MPFDWVVNNQYEKLLSGFKDGLYEVRVKNFCFGGPSLATENVHSYVYDETLLLSTDTVKPMEQTRVSSDERFHGVKFYEAIDCSASTVSVRKINSRCGGAGTASNTLVTPEQLNGYNIKCFNRAERGNWVIEFPSEPADNTRSPSTASETSPGIQSDRCTCTQMCAVRWLRVVPRLWVNPRKSTWQSVRR